MYLSQRIVLRPVDVQTAAEAAAVDGGNDGKVGGGGQNGEEEAEAAARLEGEDKDSLTHEMCGVLPFDVTMSSRMSMGYCTARLGEATAELLGLPRDTSLRCQQVSGTALSSKSSVPSTLSSPLHVLLSLTLGRC